MNTTDRVSILAKFDADRRAGGELDQQRQLVREYAPDRSECRIIHCRASPESIADVIDREKTRANDLGYTLEWKTYAHDNAPYLSEALLAAGFQSDEAEAVLVRKVVGPEGPVELPPGATIVQVRDETGLAGVAEISQEIGRKNVDAEVARLAIILRDRPTSMQVYVLEVDGRPVSTGRLHFSGSFAELAGGRTKSTDRRRGYFSALVHHRLLAAAAGGRDHVLVDARTTSEGALRKLGFEWLTETRPFIYERGASGWLEQRRTRCWPSAPLG